VTFLSAGLDEVAHVERLPAATYVLDRDALPAGLVSGQSVLWRVTAKAGGDAIARSPAAPLLVP